MGLFTGSSQFSSEKTVMRPGNHHKSKLKMQEPHGNHITAKLNHYKLSHFKELFDNNYVTVNTNKVQADAKTLTKRSTGEPIQICMLKVSSEYLL